MSKSVVQTVSLLPQLKLIDNWDQAWKFYSMWGYALLLALPSVWPDLVALFPQLDNPGALQGVVAWIVRGIAAYGILSRVIEQTKPQLPLPTPVQER